MLRTSLFRVAAGLAMLPTAGLLYLTFRPHSRAAAAFGAIALVVTGALFIVAAAATLELRGLAEHWQADGAVAGDASWLEARGIASRVEALGLFTMVGLGMSIAGIGVAVARIATLPRPLAWLGLAGGAVLLASLPLWWFGDCAWYAYISGTLSVTIAFLLTAGWLTLRGTRKRAFPIGKA